MSTPIVYCRLVKAFDGDEKVLKNLVRDMKRNLECGYWSTLPCEHEPRCRELSDEEIGQLIEQIGKIIEDINVT